MPTQTNETTRDIIKHLYEQGHYSWRNNTTGIYDRNTGQYRTSGAKTGVSDILAILHPNGQFLAIEVKTGKDRLRPEQIGFLESVKYYGGIAMTVKTFEDFLEQYKALGI